jgi:hypothetical protein
VEFESPNSIQNWLVFLGKKGEERGGRVREESGRFELVGLVARATIGSAEERERGSRKKKG